MARRHHRRHRRFHGTVSVPGLSDIPLLNESASVSDVALGVVVGLLASAGVKTLAKKFAPAAWASIETSVGKAAPLVAGAGAAAALYFGETKVLKFSRSRAVGHASGAALAGLALTAWDLLKQYQPLGLDFSETVGVNLGKYLPGRNPYSGLIINDRSDGTGMNGYNGVLITDHSDQLSELAAMSMGDDDADDVMDLVGVGD